MSERPPILPPALGLLMMLGVFSAHFIRPVAKLFPYPLNYIGLIFIVIGAILHLVADRELRRKGAVDLNGEPKPNSGVLVTSSLYSWCRNPGYLGLVLIIAGLAVWVGSLSPWLVVAVYPFCLYFLYVREEEADLERQFGERYRRYCALVPRWWPKRPK